MGQKINVITWFLYFLPYLFICVDFFSSFLSVFVSFSHFCCIRMNSIRISLGSVVCGSCVSILLSLLYSYKNPNKSPFYKYCCYIYKTRYGIHACLWPILRLIFLVNLIINIDKSVRGFVLCQRRNLVSLCMQTYLTMHFFFLTFSIGKIVVFFLSFFFFFKLPLKWHFNTRFAGLNDVENHWTNCTTSFE